MNYCLRFLATIVGNQPQNVKSTFFSLSDRVYSAWIIEQGFLSASITLFLNTLKSEKISIHKLRKDQCDVCCGHKNGTIRKMSIMII